MFWATLVIVFILSVFIIGSGIVRKVAGFDKGASESGVYIPDEEALGINDVRGYNLEHKKLVKIRYLIEDGSDLDEALLGDDYEG